MRKPGSRLSEKCMSVSDFRFPRIPTIVSGQAWIWTYFLPNTTDLNHGTEKVNTYAIFGCEQRYCLCENANRTETFPRRSRTLKSVLWGIFFGFIRQMRRDVLYRGYLATERSISQWAFEFPGAVWRHFTLCTSQLLRHAAFDRASREIQQKGVHNF